NGPNDRAKWFIIRRPRDLHSARIETGDPKLQPESEENAELRSDSQSSISGTAQYGLPPFPSSRLRSGGIVYENLVYLGRSQWLPQGAWLKIIGDRIVARGRSLPGGVIPVARVTDGSS